MSDTAWYIISGIILLVVGVLFIWIGWSIWKKQKISLLHSYHYNKVSKKNKPAFCRQVGIGMIIIGTGMVLSGVITMISGSLLSLVPLAAGLAVGTPMMLLAIHKYNR